MTNKTCELLLALLFFTILCAVAAQSDTSSKPCNATRFMYRQVAGLDVSDAPDQAQNDGRLQVCERKKTCCTQSMEINLAKHSEQLRAMISRSGDEITREAFAHSARKFREFYISLIKNSFKSLDDMFKKSYRENYIENKQVFVTLFDALERYINGTELDLKQLVDNFFSLLYQKVYILFNAEYSFDKLYQSCILMSADGVKPFGDGPRKVSLQISRSLLASRVFLEGLDSGFRVVDELLKLEVRKECAQAFLRMTYCGVCQGAIGVKPCYKFCLNVMKGCFAYRSVVNSYWNNYVNAMLKLGAKLEGPFSMEAIVEPLGVKISEAIMVFQDLKGNITAKVQSLCGTPPLRPTQSPMRRRGVRSRRSSGLGGSFPFDLLGMGKGPKPTTAAGTNLDRSEILSEQGKQDFEGKLKHRLVREVKEALGPLRDHWVQMAYSICLKNIAEGPNVTTGCWNGRDASGYKFPVVQDGIPGMFHNPEVPLNMSVPEMTVRAQVIRLQSAIQRITNAVHGADSNIIDIEDGSGESGSGSGEGSGDPQPTGPSKTVPPYVQTTTPDNTVEEIHKQQPTNENTANSVERDPFNIYQQQTGGNKGGNSGTKAYFSIWLMVLTFLFTLCW